MKSVYSLGYKGAKDHVFRSILPENKISHLIDIRSQNTFHNSPFNKYNLKALCDDLDIVYVHELALAPSRSLLSEARKREKEIEALYAGRKKVDRKLRLRELTLYYQDEFKRKYLKEIEERGGLELCMKWLNEADRPCFLCSEKYTELNTCHRKILLDYVLEQTQGIFKVIHLLETFYHRGKAHNLRKAFQHINETYFDNKLSPSEVAFTWSTRLASRHKIFTFGRFETPNLILLNTTLDSPKVPGFFINALLYHEIIHYRRFRDGLPYDHTTDFFIDELGFEQAGKTFHFSRHFFSKHLPEIEAEMELAKIQLCDYDKTLEPLFQYIDQIMTGKVKDDDEPERS